MWRASSTLGILTKPDDNCCKAGSWVQDEKTVETLEAAMSCMVITDSTQTACPILFATKAFAEAVGSHRDELLGKPVFQVAVM